MEGLNPNKVKILSNGCHDPILEDGGELNFDSTTHLLHDYMKILDERATMLLGYPHNIYCDEYVALAPLLRYHLNNFGDPFTENNYGMHSRHFEVGVLDWFSKLWEIEKDQYWGYVTHCGTEGNLHGILLGREQFPDGILYASGESHYSVLKAARMYKMECEVIGTLLTGEMDYHDLRSKLLLNKNKPAILHLNIGTTFKGGIDNLDVVIETLKECGYSQDKFYIHCDAALCGLILPFLKNAPKITFKKPIGSVSVSGHKFLGCPMPCGIQIARKKHVDILSRNIEYIASIDATISGSRGGHAPIFLWYSLSKKCHTTLQDDAKRCIQNARYLKDSLRNSGISAMLNEHSITVVFERPLEQEFIHKWQLSCERDMTHVVVMPGVTTQMLDNFVIESGGKDIEVAVMTKEHGLNQLEEAEIDAIVAEIETEKAAAEAAQKGPAERNLVLLKFILNYP
ncbi:hypothetical protein KY290_034167 [Solanum tuberosum]|uniref:Uncharacterized protein n=2 Tax=Solanum tuberosum TaxID=4113 RepID=A0ABQ7U4F4_SOLTU|nr:hypothetical protein KY289_033559 [Solanum tuberosum]KAH0741124.1 hypothetical protein KY290_034167 [Solanum tuberosum]